MLINYTIKNYQFRETTKGKGIIKYLLRDDQGKDRVVSALATVGFGNKIKKVHAIHHREAPLIDVLSKASLNEKIQVDFTSYNDKHPRGSRAPRQITAKTTKIANAYEESLITDFDSLKNHKVRLFKLLALAILILTAIMFARDSFFT